MRERRWAAITSDGRHFWLGRNSDPSDEELETLARKLRDQGMSAWLAVTEGVYYSEDPMDVLLVRSLSGDGDWQLALKAFLKIRKAAIAD